MAYEILEERERAPRVTDPYQGEPAGPYVPPTAPPVGATPPPVVRPPDGTTPAPTPLPPLVPAPTPPPPTPPPSSTSPFAPPVLPTPPPPPGSAEQATTVQGVTRTIDPTRETVEGRIKGMLSASNPLLDAAQAKALQSAQARGLSNTSMATEAGTAALIQAALPIAQADANVYGTAARDNQSVLNAVNTQNQQAINQFAGARLQSALNISQTQAQAQADLTKLVTQGNIEAGLQQIKNIMEIEKNALDNQTKLLLQSNDSVKGLFSQTQNAITQILMNRDMDAMAKDRAITELLNLNRVSIGLVGSLAGDIDLMGMLDQIMGPRTPIASQTPPPPLPPTPPPPPQDVGGPGGVGGGGP